MAALIGIQLCLYGLPAGIPDGITVFDIEIFAVHIPRDIIVAVTGQPEQLGILIKGITAAGIGYQAEKIIAAKVVDPVL